MTTYKSIGIYVVNTGEEKVVAVDKVVGDARELAFDPVQEGRPKRVYQNLGPQTI